METIKKYEMKPELRLWARIVLIIVFYILIVGIFQAIGMVVLKLPINEPDVLKSLNVKQQFILQLFSLLPGIAIVYLFRKYIDNRSFKSLGFSLKNRFIDILVGFIIAFVIMGGGSLILYSLNYINFTISQIDLYGLFLSFLLFIMVALNEEIFTRGYILNNLMSSMNRYIALVISAIIFSMMHSLNFGLTIWAFINLFLAGIILGSAYIFTRNLWFPISLHLFWNFFQGPVFGYSVSGQKTESVFAVNLYGNDLMNGGEFGFEGSIVCTIMLVLAIILIISYYHKKTIKIQEA